MTTALEPGESSDRLADRCRALADLGVEHVVVIVRGRPLSENDVDSLAGAADRLAALGHTAG